MWLHSRRLCRAAVAVLESLKENILSQASVKAIYGEPISAHGKPVRQLREASRHSAMESGARTAGC